MPARGANLGPSFEPAAHRDDPSVLCLCPLLPALYASSLVTNTKASWLMSSMLFWEGGTGYRDSCSFARLLGVSTSIILRGTWADGEGLLWKAIILDSKV